MHLQFHAVTTLAPLGVLLLFFVAHLLAGAAMPYRKGAMPPLARVAEKIASWLERRLNRGTRDESQRTARGILVVYVLIVAAIGAGWGAGALMHRPYGWVLGLAVLAASVSAMGTVKTLRAVQAALSKEDVQAAAGALAPYIDEKFEKGDAGAVARKALEYAALGFHRHCVMPVLFFACFGVSGLLAAMAVTGMRHVFGTGDAAHAHFGLAARKTDYALAYVTARVTVVLMALSALVVPKASPLRALETAWNQAGSYGTKNEGCLVAGLAGALGVTLGGRTVRRSNEVIDNKWVGPAGASAKITALDVQRGTLLVFVSYLWLIVLTSGAFIALV